MGTVALDKAWREAHRAYKNASDEALGAARAALYEGRVVRWRHGDRERMGTVVAVLGFQYHGLDVRVESSTGKVYDVAAASILDEMRPQ